MENRETEAPNRAEKKEESDKKQKIKKMSQYETKDPNGDVSKRDSSGQLECALGRMVERRRTGPGVEVRGRSCKSATPPNIEQRRAATRITQADNT